MQRHPRLDHALCVHPRGCSCSHEHAKKPSARMANRFGCGSGIARESSAPLASQCSHHGVPCQPCMLTSIPAWLRRSGSTSTRVSMSKICRARWSRQLHGVSRNILGALVKQRAPGTAVTQATPRPRCRFQGTAADSIAVPLQTAWAHNLWQKPALKDTASTFPTRTTRAGQAQSRCRR